MMTLTSPKKSISLNLLASRVDSSRWFLAAFVFPTLLMIWNLGGRASLDGHEVLVAQTAREMIERNDFILPHFAGEVRLQKPPLAYWLSAASYLILGSTSEFAARLPTAMATIATAFALAWTASRVFGAQVGMLTAMIFSTTWSTINYGKSATVDGTLACLVSLGVLAAAGDRFLGPVFSRIGPFCFWIVAGLSVLAKGPVGLVLLLLIAGIYRWLYPARTGEATFRLCAPTTLGIAAALVLSFGWPLAVAAMQPDALAIWKAQSTDRFLYHWGPTSRSWLYYFYTAPIMTLPWTPLWMFALWRVISRLVGRPALPSLPPGDVADTRLAEEFRNLLWIWFLVAFVFFSLSAGKREHYLLPGLPPLAVLAAIELSPLVSTWLNPRRLVWASIALIGVVCAWESQVTPLFSRNEEALKLFARQRPLLDQADRVIQFGSNDRWAIFTLARPMTWTKDVAEVRACCRHCQCLLLCPEEKFAELSRNMPLEVIDFSPARRSLLGQRLEEPLVLARIKETTR